MARKNTRGVKAGKWVKIGHEYYYKDSDTGETLAPSVEDTRHSYGNTSKAARYEVEVGTDDWPMDFAGLREAKAYAVANMYARNPRRKNSYHIRITKNGASYGQLGPYSTRALALTDAGALKNPGLGVSVHPGPPDYTPVLTEYATKKGGSKNPRRNPVRVGDTIYFPRGGEGKVVQISNKWAYVGEHHNEGWFPFQAVEEMKMRPNKGKRKNAGAVGKNPSDSVSGTFPTFAEFAKAVRRVRLQNKNSWWHADAEVAGRPVRLKAHGNSIAAGRYLIGMTDYTPSHGDELLWQSGHRSVKNFNAFLAAPFKRAGVKNPRRNYSTKDSSYSGKKRWSLLRRYPHQWTAQNSSTGAVVMGKPSEFQNQAWAARHGIPKYIVAEASR
jgi:hypothetical protein